MGASRHHESTPQPNQSRILGLGITPSAFVAPTRTTVHERCKKPGLWWSSRVIPGCFSSGRRANSAQKGFSGSVGCGLSFFPWPDAPTGRLAFIPISKNLAVGPHPSETGLRHCGFLPRSFRVSHSETRLAPSLDAVLGLEICPAIPRYRSAPPATSWAQRGSSMPRGASCGPGSRGIGRGPPLDIFLVLKMCPPWSPAIPRCRSAPPARPWAHPASSRQREPR